MSPTSLTGRNAARSIGLVASLLLPAMMGGRGWDVPAFRITPPRRYRSPDIPRDDAGHLAAAEAKRQRKKIRKEINARRASRTWLNLGDYSATPVGYGRLMGCGNCMVEWTGCWDNFLCPICGEGELPTHYGSLTL